MSFKKNNIKHSILKSICIYAIFILLITDKLYSEDTIAFNSRHINIYDKINGPTINKFSTPIQMDNILIFISTKDNTSTVNGYNVIDKTTEQLLVLNEKLVYLTKINNEQFIIYYSNNNILTTNASSNTTNIICYDISKKRILWNLSDVLPGDLNYIGWVQPINSNIIIYYYILSESYDGMVSNETSILCCYKNNKIKWKKIIDNSYPSPLLEDKNILWIKNGQKILYVNIINGKVINKSNNNCFNQNIYNIRKYNNNYIIITDKSIDKMDDNFKIHWSYSINQYYNDINALVVLNSHNIYNDRLIFDTSEIPHEINDDSEHEYRYDYSYIYSIDINKGLQIWQKYINGHCDKSIVINDFVFVAADNGYVYTINPNNGDILVTYHIEGRL